MRDTDEENDNIYIHVIGLKIDSVTDVIVCDVDMLVSGKNAIQGSGLRPASYMVTAADLHPSLLATELSSSSTTRTWSCRFLIRVHDSMKIARIQAWAD